VGIICDPQRAVAEAIAAALEQVGGVSVGSCTTSVGGALAAETVLRPDVAVVSPQPSGRPLGAVVSAFQEASPGLAIVVLTGVRHHDAAGSDPGWKVQYLDLGARLADLIAAVHLGAALRVRGDSPRGTGYRLGNDGRGDLTGREWQVLECMADGLDATGTGRRLSITTHTARTHLKNIYRRLGVHSGPEALAAARRV
jgi:two-component system nitrate/nitrite response regulator NarL